MFILNTNKEGRSRNSNYLSYNTLFAANFTRHNTSEYSPTAPRHVIFFASTSQQPALLLFLSRETQSSVVTLVPQLPCLWGDYGPLHPAFPAPMPPTTNLPLHVVPHSLSLILVNSVQILVVVSEHPPKLPHNGFLVAPELQALLQHSPRVCRECLYHRAI